MATARNLEHTHDTMYTKKKSERIQSYKMARLNGWKCSTEDNCMLYLTGNTTEFPPLPRMRSKSSSAIKSITIKVQSEVLTVTRNLEHIYYTRCTKKKSERRLTTVFPHLEIPNHSRVLVLLDPTVVSHSKSTPTKKWKCGEHFVGCCSCGLTSKCSNKRCV